MSATGLDLQSILGLLKDNDSVFYIPELQRGFLWDRKRIRDLLDALWASAGDNVLEFFVGQMISEKASRNGGAAAWPEGAEEALAQTDSIQQCRTVVDGQQRLTTISLLAAALFLYSQPCIGPGRPKAQGEGGGAGAGAGAAAQQQAAATAEREKLISQLRTNQKDFGDAVWFKPSCESEEFTAPYGPRMYMRTDKAKEQWQSLLTTMLTEANNMRVGASTWDKFVEDLAANPNAQGPYSRGLLHVCQWLDERFKQVAKAAGEEHTAKVQTKQVWVGKMTEPVLEYEVAMPVPAVISSLQRLHTHLTSVVKITHVSTTRPELIFQLFDAANTQGLSLEAQMVLKYRLTAKLRDLDIQATGAHHGRSFAKLWNECDEILRQWDRFRKLIKRDGADKEEAPAGGKAVATMVDEGFAVEEEPVDPAPDAAAVSAIRAWRLDLRPFLPGIKFVSEAYTAQAPTAVTAVWDETKNTEKATQLQSFANFALASMMYQAAFPTIQANPRRDHGVDMALHSLIQLQDLAMVQKGSRRFIFSLWVPAAVTILYLCGVSGSMGAMANGGGGAGAGAGAGGASAAAAGGDAATTSYVMLSDSRVATILLRELEAKLLALIIGPQNLQPPDVIAAEMAVHLTACWDRIPGIIRALVRHGPRPWLVLGGPPAPAVDIEGAPRWWWDLSRKDLTTRVGDPQPSARNRNTLVPGGGEGRLETCLNDLFLGKKDSKLTLALTQLHANQRSDAGRAIVLRWLLGTRLPILMAVYQEKLAWQPKQAGGAGAGAGGGAVPVPTHAGPGYGFHPNGWQPVPSQTHVGNGRDAIENEHILPINTGNYPDDMQKELKAFFHRKPVKSEGKGRAGGREKAKEKADAMRVHKLGNLLPLEKRLNSKVQHLMLMEKQQGYKGSGQVLRRYRGETAEDAVQPPTRCNTALVLAELPEAAIPEHVWVQRLFEGKQEFELDSVSWFYELRDRVVVEALPPAAAGAGGHPAAATDMASIHIMTLVPHLRKDHNVPQDRLWPWQKLEDYKAAIVGAGPAGAAGAGPSVVTVAVGALDLQPAGGWLPVRQQDELVRLLGRDEDSVSDMLESWTLANLKPLAKTIKANGDVLGCPGIVTRVDRSKALLISDIAKALVASTAAMGLGGGAGVGDDEDEDGDAAMGAGGGSDEEDSEEDDDDAEGGGDEDSDDDSSEEEEGGKLAESGAAGSSPSKRGRR